MDAAKRGVSRLRRASVRMSDLTSVIDLDSSNDMNDASPRKRAESSGSLFGGSDEEEETGGTVAQAKPTEKGKEDEETGGAVAQAKSTEKGKETGMMRRMKCM